MLAASLFLLAPTSGAQDYPTKLVRTIVPTSAAGAVDNYSRLDARELQATFGQSLTIENQPGATGLVRNELARLLASDGYTSDATTAMCRW